MKPTIAVIGCGWLGFPLAQQLIEMGHNVVGSTTRFEKLASLEQAGIKPVRLILKEGEIIGDVSLLITAEIVIVDIPPGRSDPEARQHYPESVSRLVGHWPGTYLRQIIFTSSTSVYGSEQGEVNEDTPPLPDSESGKAVLAAENALQMTKLPLNILRLGGLVGGDRHPVKYLAGRSDLKHPYSPVNLIHRDDVIEVIKILIESQAPISPINVVAPEHPTRQEYYQWVARRRGLEPPVFATGNSRGGKLVRPGKLLSLKNFAFRYPSPFDMV